MKGKKLVRHKIQVCNKLYVPENLLILLSSRTESDHYLVYTTDQGIIQIWKGRSSIHRWQENFGDTDKERVDWAINVIEV